MQCEPNVPLRNVITINVSIYSPQNKYKSLSWVNSQSRVASQNHGLRIYPTAEHHTTSLIPKNPYAQPHSIRKHKFPIDH
jgi:hypothetical protein